MSSSMSPHAEPSTSRAKCRFFIGEILDKKTNRAPPGFFLGICGKYGRDAKFALGTSGATRILVSWGLPSRLEEERMCSSSSVDDACHTRFRYKPKPNTTLRYSNFRKDLSPRAPGENSPRGASTTAERGSRPHLRRSRTFIVNREKKLFK